ncbi:hypothetical protein RB623_17225 [Mesorhizobium sp. LHD-90]|uniref:hypothetical protein n=1 Tax=Mesorhizobium sp. LHD-90 TaxID=3071414 RepID=UPI0027E198EC|nr:hypothetical protein [Mesorhizobium sp. LHD-90]MDQ6435800.1 hypothetical protein [Mesorhizobium sp. LHD-90]
MSALLAGELAWYATGRFYQASKDDSLADYGYFLHLPFIEAPLFDGAISETTAHFTFAAKPFKAPEIDNGALKLGLDPVGEFSLYLQRRPAGTYDNPASFGEGKRIATFRRTSMVVGTTVDATVGKKTVSVVGANVFSARLTASTPFEFGGHRYDLSDHLGPGITQFGTAGTVPIEPTPKGYKLVLPFTGSAVALGRTA